MYQTPRMMVPVRTWQHRQQLVEYQRSHGDIIIIILPVVCEEESPLSQLRPLRVRPPLRNDEQNPPASDLSVTYHREQLNGAERPASSQR